MRFIPSFPLLACMALWLLSPVPSPADKPNIVLILADDMGWSDLGCYGSEIPTPHLDSLAAQGMLATRCYTASRCSPSRASIMTGCEPHKVDVGLLDDDSGRPGYRGRLNPDIPTLPELLKKAGYRTYLSGKWHLGKVRGTYPWDRGFDRSRGLLGGAADYYKPMPDRPFGEDGKLLRPEDLPEDFYMTEDITQTALAYIDDAAKSKKPFFLYVAYTAPHTPLQAPREEIEKMLPSYRGKSPHAIASKRLEKQKQLGIVPPSAKLGMAGKFNPSGYEKATAERKDYLSRCMATYAAQISIMDRGIGRILASLDRHRLSGNTIVMFLSDNGATTESFNSACLFLCSTIAAALAEYKSSLIFEVLYIQAERQQGQTFLRVTGYAQGEHNNDIPSLLAQPPRPVTGTPSMLDEQLFAERHLSPVVLSGPAEVRRSFFRKRNQPPEEKYMQYLAIPVLSRRNEIIGLIEVSVKKNPFIFPVVMLETHELADIRSWLYHLKDHFLLFHEIERAVRHDLP